MMTRNMSWRKPKLLDMDIFGAQERKTVLHFFVRQAHLGLHREQPRELGCLVTVIVDCLLR